MKFSSYHIILCLAGLSSIFAAPNDMTAKYDDLPNTVASVPLSSYQGVNYGDWVYASAQAVQVGGLDTRSYPSRIGSGLREAQVFSPQSPYQALALYDFYFGCVVRTTTPAATLATACTVTLIGYPSTGKAVVTASFKFTPPVSPATPVPMVQAVLPTGFKQKLSKVEFKVDTPLAKLASVDNLHYGLYTS
ncbi:MAG: hypothetical protein Q9207_006475 [Kuettlingeria erythrocarpa]